MKQNIKKFDRTILKDCEVYRSKSEDVDFIKDVWGKYKINDGYIEVIIHESGTFVKLPYQEFELLPFSSVFRGSIAKTNQKEPFKSSYLDRNIIISKTKSQLYIYMTDSFAFLERCDSNLSKIDNYLAPPETKQVILTGKHKDDIYCILTDKYYYMNKPTVVKISPNRIDICEAKHESSGYGDKIIYIFEGKAIINDNLSKVNYYVDNIAEKAKVQFEKVYEEFDIKTLGLPFDIE